MYLSILVIILILIVLVVIIWVAYATTPSQQQTLSVSVPFDETYRYIPSLNTHEKFKIDSIKLTVMGSIKKDTETIVLMSQLKDLVREKIVDPYRNCLIMHEANTFTIEENKLKRCPMVKNPTLEHLAIIFFNKLYSLTPHLGCKLNRVTIISNGMKASYSRKFK